MVKTQRPAFEKHGTDLGTYWTSPLSKSALHQRLRECALGRFKAAAIGGDQESGFEQAFASLAYTYLKEKAPRLIDFIVGFQLVDRNEDNTKAVALFGFKVGDQWLYGPVFFLNGDLKGHELLYIKKQDAFVPMKENWVNYLIARKPHELGKASPRNTQELGGLLPNLMRLAHPPTGTKYGSDGVHVDGWARPALPLLAALATKQARALYDVKTAGALDFARVVASPHAAALAPTAAAFDMRSVLRDFGLLKLAYEKFYRRYPLIKQGFDRFYGPDFFAEMARQARDRIASEDLIKRARSYVLPPRRVGKKKASPFLIPGPDAPEHPVKTGALQIIVRDAITGGYGWLDKSAANEVDPDVAIAENKPELTDEERERLLRDTVLIKDRRDPHAVSMAYNTQVRTELTNPDATGLFEVLEKPGTFDRMLVIMHPQTGNDRRNFATVVRMSDPRAWLNTHPTNLWVRQDEAPLEAEFREWLDGLPDTRSLSKGGTYVAIAPDGSGTCPFQVREDYGDGAYRVSWEDHCQYDKTRPVSLPQIEEKKNGPPDDFRPFDAKIWVNRKGQKLRSANNELAIPEAYKIITVAAPPKPDGDEEKPGWEDLISAARGEEPKPDDDNPNPEDKSASKPAPIEAGNLIDIQLMLHKQAAAGELTPIRIHDTGGGELWIKARGVTDRMTKKAALISLVRDHGLREAQARVLIKEAAAAAHRNGAVNYVIKYAAPFGSTLQPGPGAPAFPQPMTGMEQVGPGAYPAIYSQEEFQPVPGMDSNLTDPSVYDPFYMPDQKATQQAQTASQAGQKEVFDTSMVSGLLKSVRQESLVDRYMGDLMKALNTLGRLIFLFYWHQEEFADRYGKADVPELEDSLRNTFESLGDLVLFLKEKSVQGRTGVEFGNQSVDDDAPDPNIAASARN